MKQRVAIQLICIGNNVSRYSIGWKIVETWFLVKAQPYIQVRPSAIFLLKSRLRYHQFLTPLQRSSDITRSFNRPVYTRQDMQKVSNVATAWLIHYWRTFRVSVSIGDESMAQLLIRADVLLDCLFDPNEGKVNDTIMYHREPFIQ